MKVYFISGLGADRRVFRHVQLPAGCAAAYLDWIPAEKNESLEAYSTRLAKKIDPQEPFALLGLSMGGMIASEIARQFANREIKPVATILISSVPVHADLPRYFRLAELLAIHTVIPIKLLKSLSYLKRFVFPGKAEDDKILNEVIRDSDPVFIKWAMNAVLRWRNDVVPAPVFHLHGNRDRILPLKRRHFTKVIPGGHMIIMERPAEINSFISQVLTPNLSSTLE